MQGNTQASLYKYYVIRYVRDVKEEVGVTFALVALSVSQPSFIALKQIPSWAPVLQLDSEAELTLLTGFLNELSDSIRLDSQYLDLATRWENCIRILPPQEFLTSDFHGTFSLLADAEFGSAVVEP